MKCCNGCKNRDLCVVYGKLYGWGLMTTINKVSTGLLRQTMESIEKTIAKDCRYYVEVGK